MNGVLIINKPKNYTSFDIIAVTRKLLGIKKIGHTGTLDPMATGVLPVLIGRATKLQAFLANDDKEYVASFKLGITTDTLDVTGKILSSTVSAVKTNQIEEALCKFKGNIKQIPPMYSAVQKNGIRLYTLARKGMEVERDARNVIIHKLKLINFNEFSQEGKILVNCSKGTYIRTLCNDIGQFLGCGAVLTELKRTSACSFNIRQSITLDQVREFSINNKILEYILPCDYVLKDYKKVSTSQAQAIRFKNGGGLNLDRISLPSHITDGELLRVYNGEKDFLGLGRINLKKAELSIACLIDI